MKVHHSSSQICKKFPPTRSSCYFDSVFKIGQTLLLPKWRRIFLWHWILVWQFSTKNIIRQKLRIISNFKPVFILYGPALSTTVASYHSAMNWTLKKFFIILKAKKSYDSYKTALYCKISLLPEVGSLIMSGHLFSWQDFNQRNQFQTITQVFGKVLDDLIYGLQMLIGPSGKSILLNAFPFGVSL